MNMRLLIADDQQLVREGLAALLALEPDLEIVAQVGRGDEVLEAAQATGAEIALLDVEMPGMDGIAVAAQLRQELPNCRSLIVTTFGRPGYLRRAMDAGARGFVVKDTPARELAAAIRTIATGGRVIDPQLAAEAMVEGANPLTAREIDVLRAAVDGSAVRRIADTLHLSPGTVRNHLSAAIAKTGATNRTEAAHLARSKGWL